MRLILASKSPRRKRLLLRLGMAFEVAAPSLREPAVVHANPAELAKRRALAKAAEISLLHPSDLVLGADTVIALGKKVLGKPNSRKEARKMLERMNGRRIAAITGVALLCESHDLAMVWAEKAVLKFGRVGERALQNYIKSGRWKGKAGGFNIDETPARRWIKVVSGERETAVGLPGARLRDMLARVGV